MKKPSRPRRTPATFNIYEAKSHLSELVDRAAKGEEIVISKRGKPLARLAPVRRESPKFGLLKGKLTIARDFDAPLPAEIQRLFEGKPNDRK